MAYATQVKRRLFFAFALLVSWIFSAVGKVPPSWARSTPNSSTTTVEKNTPTVSEEKIYTGGFTQMFDNESKDSPKNTLGQQDEVLLNGIIDTLNQKVSANQKLNDQERAIFLLLLKNRELSQENTLLKLKLDRNPAN